MTPKKRGTGGGNVMVGEGGKWPKKERYWQRKSNDNYSVLPWLGSVQEILVASQKTKLRDVGRVCLRLHFLESRRCVVIMYRASSNSKSHSESDKTAVLLYQKDRGTFNIPAEGTILRDISEKNHRQYRDAMPCGLHVMRREMACYFPPNAASHNFYSKPCTALRSLHHLVTISVST